MFDFYRGKRVLVTGHTGFKGSWLTMMLAELGAEVHGYALAPPTTPSLFEEAAVEGLLASHHVGDVRDHAEIARVVREVEPEMVFHLAAQALVLEGLRQPRETYEVNVMGTVNLLEAVRQSASVRVCQVITSDKCYENAETGRAHREEDPMGGRDPYSSSKGCAELAAAAYRQSFFSTPSRGVSLATARAGNVIGGGDWAADRIIPDCVRALEKGEPIIVRNPEAVRPWQHVLEPLSGYLTLGAAQWREPGRFAEAWNFGPGEGSEVAVREVVERVIGEWGGGTWRAADAREEREAAVLRLDVGKARGELGWKSVLSLGETIGWTVRWYRERFEGAGAFSGRGVCGEQVREYFGRASLQAGAQREP